MRKKTARTLLLLAALLLIAALVFLLFRFVFVKRETDDAPLPEETESAVVFSPSEPGDALRGEIPDSNLFGSFVNSYSALYMTNPKDAIEFQDGNIPTIEIREDRSFALSIYAPEIGSITLQGTVEWGDGLAVFEIANRSFEGFVGDDLDSFVMTLANKDELLYHGEQLGTLTEGDVFSRSSTQD